MMKAEIPSTSHPANDVNTQPLLFERLAVNHFHWFMFIVAMAHVISSTPSLGAKVRSTDDRAQFAGALFKFETPSRVLAENENMY